MHLTLKQLNLVTVIATGDAAGKPLDLDQILDAINYETTKQSLQFSIRALIAKGLILKRGQEKRRGRQRQVIDATPEGRLLVGVDKSVPTGPAFVVDELTDELEGVVEETEKF